jgi:1,2-diacylglycerol-3-alpha-glucose alpha-1,2-glucosyltransferase
MKVLLYRGKEIFSKRSGIGRAFLHQKKALEKVGIEYTTDPKDTYDIVHVNLGNSSVIKKFKKKYPVIVHGHSTVEDFRRSFALWRFIAPFFRKHLQNIYGVADMIITPTRYSKFLIESMAVVDCPVLAISNGIDLSEYEFKQERVDKFRTYFNLNENDKVVIGVGLLFERKGLHDFFEVARRLPDYKFIWFGYLHPLIRTHFINKAIKRKPNNVIMPGYLDGEIIKGAFLNANCVFFPSYEETEGIVVLEALASKSPLVIRDIPVYYDWLEDQKHVLKGNNNNDFVQIIDYIVNHDMSKMTEEGYKIAEARSIDKVALQLKDAYEKVLKIKEEKK